MNLNELKNAIDSSPVYDVAIKSPVETLSLMSERLGNTVYLKREDLQPVRSFKIRGAYHKIAQLDADTLSKGIIAASAGNHAQGVALSAQKRGLQATIVMPKITPDIKVNSVKRFGGNVVLAGNNYDEAFEHAQHLVKETGATFIPPFNDVDVIAGQGTIAKELLEQLDTIDVIFVAVGGGGLLAGILGYIKQVKPSIKVIGVEPEDAGCLYAAWKAGHPVELKEVGIFADGVAVKQIGDVSFEMIQKAQVDDVMLVSTDEICAALKDMYDDVRAIAEPSGAVSLAGLKKYVSEHNIKNQHLVAINCGANMNFDRLRHIAERAQVGENAEALFSVKIPETPGSFKQFCTLIGDKSITEFNYRYSDDSDAFIFVGIGLKEGQKEKDALIKLFEKHNYDAIDVSHDDVAVLHIRHMVGGKSQAVSNERIYRFQFPERPGALMNFLNHLSDTWNISLFHYRNHGSDYGRVLVGIQVPDEDENAFLSFLDQLGYSYFNETNNPVIKQFL
jgi:threonine dehydratase